MIVFLDFDGVLHPFFPLPDRTDAENAVFSCLPAFEGMLRKYPHVNVVISSSWRLRKSPAEVLGLFSEDIRPRIIGFNPPSPGTTGNDPGARMKECEAWLETHDQTTTPWLALDDYAALFSPGARVLVCHDGFREREIALFDEAMADIEAFAVRYPVKASGARTHADGSLIFLPPGVSLAK